MTKVQITFEMRIPTTENSYQSSLLTPRREIIALCSENCTEHKMYSVSNIQCFWKLEWN